VFATLYGLWLGVAVPTALGADDGEAYGAGLLVGGPLGLFSARAVTRSRSLTEGQVRAISWGGIWGTWQGFGVAEVLDIGEDVICDPRARPGQLGGLERGSGRVDMGLDLRSHDRRRVRRGG
jgi:hypothetical protein